MLNHTYHFDHYACYQTSLDKSIIGKTRRI